MTRDELVAAAESIGMRFPIAAQVEAPKGDEFERGRQQGIQQERALWQLAADSQAMGEWAPKGEREAFQQRVSPWMNACFGPEIARDTVERNHRFLEEALELVQACGCTKDEAHQLVDYVFGRLVGEPEQEVGGVMVTLAALCLAQGFDMHEAGETELARIWTKVDVIRAKQAAKPKHSPLPATPQQDAAPAERLKDEANTMTYKNQPTDNVDAWRLGEACRRAADEPKCGDYIDRGLILLRELEAKGYGVARLAAPAEAQPSGGERG